MIWGPAEPLCEEVDLGRGLPGRGGHHSSDLLELVLQLPDDRIEFLPLEDLGQEDTARPQQLPGHGKAGPHKLATPHVILKADPRKVGGEIRGHHVRLASQGLANPTLDLRGGDVSLDQFHVPGAEGPGLLQIHSDHSPLWPDFPCDELQPTPGRAPEVHDTGPFPEDLEPLLDLEELVGGSRTVPFLLCLLVKIVFSIVHGWFLKGSFVKGIN
jgi:hypothetical protein